MEGSELEDPELSGAEEEFDERKHSRLLDAISSLDGKKGPKQSQRTIISNDVSEFGFSRGGGKSKVHLHELIGTLSKDSASHGGLHKQLKTVQKRNKIISAPLPKQQQEKIDRSVAYQKTSEQLKKWDSVVEKNRQADQLVFPLERPNLKLSTTGQFVKKFKPRTPLEMEVAALLQGSQNVHHKKVELTPAEEKALQAMSLEEAQERRAELQKYRALMSYKEAKARWQKRIKSKRYHRVLRKEKLKNEKKTLEDLKNTDPEAYLDKIKEVEDERIQERMSLKYRGGSKFSKKQTIYAKYDSRARQAVQDMIEKSQELRQKRVVESDSDSEGVPIEEEVVTGDVPEGKDNPWMTNSRVLKTKTLPCKEISDGKKPSCKEYSRPEAVQSVSEVISEDDNSSVEGDNRKSRTNLGKNIDEIFIELEKKKKSTAKKRKVSKAISETKSEKPLTQLLSERKYEIERNDAQLIDENLERKTTLEEFEDIVEEETPLESAKVEKKNDDKEKKKEKEVFVDPKKLFTKQSELSKLEMPEVVGGGEDEEQIQTIAEAFADDDVVEDFRKEKREAVEREKPKDIDLTLPGWGSWGGQGLTVPKKKQKKFLIKAAPSQPRKDRNLSNVMINEEKDAAISKVQVNELPFPYTSVKQFEQSIRTPIGKTWIPETAYKQLVRPKVVTKLGQIISPIDKSEVFSKQKTGKKRKPDMSFESSVDDKKKNGPHRKFRKLKGKK